MSNLSSRISVVGAIGLSKLDRFKPSIPGLDFLSNEFTKEKKKKILWQMYGFRNHVSNVKIFRVGYQENNINLNHTLQKQT